MSYPAEALVVRPDDVEHVEMSTGRFLLVADAAETGGMLGVNRLSLDTGADGAQPHHHAASAELFSVVEGAAEFLLGSRMVRVEAGGAVLIPPGMVHSFGAAPGCAVELLIILTPGVDRFEYFRTLARIDRGEESFPSLLPLQDQFDVHFDDPATWRRLRGHQGNAEQ